MDEALEVFVGSGKLDKQGREIGFTVGLRQMQDGAYAWVQAARRSGHDFNDFGVKQRSRRFDTMEAANAWAYSTANRRIADLK